MPGTGDNVQLVEVALPATLAVGTVETIQLPENSELAAVTVDGLGTAPVGSSAIFDVLDNAVSVFAGVIGTLRNAIGTTDTSFVFTPGATGAAPEVGQVVTIGTEDIVIGAVTGSPLTSGASPEYQCSGLTRAANGTTAATHAAAANVLPAKPKVVAAATASSGKYVASPPASRNVPPLPTGSDLAVTITQVGSGTAGGGGTLTLELIQR